ncbi:MAG: YihY/virulence factor BrkB family protein [Nocardioides sp.]
MPDLVDRVDELQRRRRAISVPLAVVYKFFDDQGNYLAAILTYYAFIAIFPLLLIASSVLGFLLRDNEMVRNAVLDSALSQFPIVGSQLGRAEGLQGSTSAVVIGSLTALYGIVGLGQAAQNAVNTTWAVPRNSRLNPVMSRVRSLALMVLAGTSVMLLAVLSSVASNVDVFGSEADAFLNLMLCIATVVITAAVLSAMLGLATRRRHRFSIVLPGGLTIAVGWHLLQTLGGVYVDRVVNRVSEMSGVFALVLGLIAMIYVAAMIAVLGMEVNVVLHRRLYPRALLAPFTDTVQLTEADRRVYTDYARAQRHKGFEKVHVTFDRGDDG